MTRAVSESLGWLRRQALSYLVIVALLIGGGWLFNEYRRAHAGAAELQQAGSAVQQQEAAAARAQRRLALAEQPLAAQAAAARRARDLAQQAQAAAERERDAYRARHWPWVGLYGAEALARDRLLDERAAALQAAAGAAQHGVAAAEALQDSAAALRRLDDEARGKQARADSLRAQWRRLSAAHPIAQQLPWAPVGAELDRLKAQVERLQQEAAAAQQRQREIADSAARSREVAEWLQARAALGRAEAALQEASARHAALAHALDRNAWRRVQLHVQRFLADKSGVFLLALAILLGAIASRLALKLLLYFVVAPLASRAAPGRLSGAFEPRAFARAVPGAAPGRISSESIPLHLAPGEELLVRPDYLQSSSERSAKRTALLLNAALPITSLLSGMYLLTRVRAAEGDDLVLSPAQDAFDEVCMIDLPAGAAFVCQPRALAGIVQPHGERARVTRHWRLASLHAWLTFQLRFLVFHGPCRLVLKGRRGVRMEAAGGGRLIDRAATLGFDASVPWSNARCETFVPYWLGKDRLFNDRFGGIDGSYVYEERPLDRRGNVLVGRGLEGLFEAVLKLFGI